MRQFSEAILLFTSIVEYANDLKNSLFLTYNFIMSSKITRPIFNIAQTGPVKRGVVIFLHGSGDTGPDVWKYITHLVPDFGFKHLKILLPTAPRRPYTPADGEISTVWFDRQAINRSSPEQLSSVDAMAEELLTVIKEEEAAGTPVEKMIVGGFSMGGAMALHLAIRHVPNIAGVFALSSFINDDSVLLQSKPTKAPPLFQWHGTRDPMVPMSWGMQSYAALQDLGIKGEFHIGQNALHELKRDCLLKLKDWINSKLPDVKQPKI